MRRHQLRIILCTFALGSAGVGACRSTSDETRLPSSEAAPIPTPADDVRREALSLPLAPRMGPESRQAERGQRDPLDRLLPPEHPPQRLALSRYRLAELDGEQLIVRRLGDLEIVTSFAVPDGRNVVPLVGGGFLIAGRDYVQRLSGVERRAELFPRAPRLGPTTIIGSTQDSQQFWLHYEGVSQLAQFDLAREPLGASLPVVGFVELADFDHRALLGYGDGSVVYTTPYGFARIDVEGRRERLPAPELAGRVFRLVRAARFDQLWAATPHHLYRIGVRGEVSVADRLDLPPHPLALASSGAVIAVLSIEALRGRSAHLRVDVRSGTELAPRVLRFEAGLDVAPDAGQPAAFSPEIALSPDGNLLAVRGFGLHVFDWRTERRSYPPAAAQNLAPPAP